MYILDTNVVSDAYKGVAEPTRWLERVDRLSVHLSVVTIGEIERGIHMLIRKNAKKAEAIADWLGRLRRDNATRILDVTEEVALRWGQISTGKARGDADSLIAATALVHDLTLVTRNVGDFADTGVRLFNPWQA